MQTDGREKTCCNTVNKLYNDILPTSDILNSEQVNKKMSYFNSKCTNVQKQA